jgi:EH domain-containing protein 1
LKVTTFNAIIMADWAATSDYNGRGSMAYEHDAAAGGSASAVRDEVADRTQRVADELKALYKRAVLPVEKKYRYDYFFESPFMSDVEFDGKRMWSVCGVVKVVSSDEMDWDSGLTLSHTSIHAFHLLLAKPQVLLVGQYSVGKTSFIRYLLGRDFPGQRIGPEPTTDRFTVLLNGPEERTIPGNALSVHPELPFRGLDRFGVNFLSRLEGSQLPSSVLRSITLVDTPGILSGEKQRVSRGYDFTKVVAWFAEKADLIILLFDAHKLDISDELKGAIDVLRGHDDKIRCILNKADQIDRQQLMRVYGALLWSLGKTMSSPEVARVYVGSFWEQPLQSLDNAQLFEAEERDLMKDLAVLPRQSAVRKINELVKRIRKVRTLAYIVGYLKAQMPNLMGKQKKQAKLIEDLPNVFRSIMKKYNLSPGDFPDLAKFGEKLRETNFAEVRVESVSMFCR